MAQRYPIHQARIDYLMQEIRRHITLYYSGKPEISDMEFDLLHNELRQLDPGNPVLREIGMASLEESGGNPNDH